VLLDFVDFPDLVFFVLVVFDLVVFDVFFEVGFGALVEVAL
jgi:hypothetical protein